MLIFQRILPYFITSSYEKLETKYRVINVRCELVQKKYACLRVAIVFEFNGEKCLIAKVTSRVYNLTRARAHTFTRCLTRVVVASHCYVFERKLIAQT